MLRNIIYKDKNIEIIIVVSSNNINTNLFVYVYDGPGIRSRLQCDFSTKLIGSLLPVVLVACWTLVREEGSVSDEMHASVNAAIRKEVMNPTTKPREIDWTKQIPTEFGSRDTN